MRRTLIVGFVIVGGAAAAGLAVAGRGAERPVPWRIVGTTGEGAQILVAPSRNPLECETYRVEVVSETASAVGLRVLERERRCSGDAVGEVAPALSVAPSKPLGGRRVDGVDLVEPRAQPVWLGNSFPTVLDQSRGLPDSRGLSVAQAVGLWFEYGIRPAVSGSSVGAVVVDQAPRAGTPPERPIGEMAVTLRATERRDGG